MLTDTHAHLDYPDYEEDFPQVLARAKEAGVTRIVMIGTSLESSRRVVQLAEQNSMLHAVIGVHPTSDGLFDDRVLEDLRKLATHPKVVAIGETGLDYHRLPGCEKRSHVDGVMKAMQAEVEEDMRLDIADGAEKARQAELFDAQLELAASLGLNVVIHQRDAWTDTLNQIAPYEGRLRGVFHCFGGTPEQAQELEARGHLVSFTGIVTFKNAGVVRETTAAVSSDCYMVETDCPYLAPVPYRGKRCEPAHVRLIAEKVAELRGIPLDQVAMESEATANQFFRFSSR